MTKNIGFTPVFFVLALGENALLHSSQESKGFSMFREAQRENHQRQSVEIPAEGIMTKNIGLPKAQPF